MPIAKEILKSLSTPLQMLRKIRDVMALPEPPQARLDKLVRSIAQDFQAEVCSVYLLRAGDVLELYASEGLNADAVHLTRLQVGQGLVGEIAAHNEPLNLADAQSHPNYVYRPETGEEIYRSFVGVPIVHSGRVMGVLVVQSTVQKHFTEEQMEVLQTIAMVLAELTVSGKLVNLNELHEGTSEAIESQRYGGQRLSPGLAYAPAVLHHPRLSIGPIVSDDPKQEQERLQKAIHDLQESVDLLIKSINLEEESEQREIMETYRMFTHDRGWLKQLGEAIASGLTAEAAVTKVKDQLHARMSMVSSEYIRERMTDLEDLSNRLLQILAGEERVTGALPDAFVLVAENLGPAELLDYGNTRLKGIVLEHGSSTSHIAIIARAMEIPVVGNVKDATRRIHTADAVAVDGDNGQVYLRPNDEVRKAIEDHIHRNVARERAYEADQHVPAITLDGTRISLNLNVGLFIEPRHLQAADVDGVGLYRTELPYMTAVDFPGVPEQRRIYKMVIEQAAGKRIIFRSFDIGGDKQVPYLDIPDEENPAMGWRATRIGLDRPSILCRQFKALIQASAGRELCLMFPFIAEIAELDATRDLLDMELDKAKQEGQQLPSHIRIGTMIEIPSILFQLPDLMRKVDFVSIGSNDLLQFLFAADRGTQKVADRYDVLSPVVLRVIRKIVGAGKAAGIEVGFCGEMARKPLEAMALLGIGLRALSMPHSSIGPVKDMVRSVNLEALATFMDYLTGLPDSSVRNQLTQFAKDHGVQL